MSDCRLGAPEGRLEQAGGDGAAAFVMGNGDDVIAEIVASASFTREFLDTWRMPEERFGHSWEERFALTQAYVPLLGKVIRVRARKGRRGARGARARDPRFAQPARGRRDRARDEARPGEARRHARAHRRADRRRACGPAADRRAAVAQARRPGIDGRGGRRRRRDRVARDAGGGEVSAALIRSAA